jgi:hypothetical protein
VRHNARTLALWMNKHQNAGLPVPPAPNKRNNEEHRAQATVCSWWDVAHKGFGIPWCLLYATPNGSQRDPIVGAILKREGVKRGTADLTLLVQRNGKGALFVEMKAKDGVVSPDQRAFLKAVIEQGYVGRVCYSAEEAIKLIGEYLGGDVS